MPLAEPPSGWADPLGGKGSVNSMGIDLGTRGGTRQPGEYLLLGASSCTASARDLILVPPQPWRCWLVLAYLSWVGEARESLVGLQAGWSLTLELRYWCKGVLQLGLEWGLVQCVGVGHLPDRCAAHMLIRGILPDIEEKAGRVVRVGGGIEVSSLLAASAKERALEKTSMRAVGLQ